MHGRLVQVVSGCVRWFTEGGVWGDVPISGFGRTPEVGGAAKGGVGLSCRMGG